MPSKQRNISFKLCFKGLINAMSYVSHVINADWNVALPPLGGAGRTAVEQLREQLDTLSIGTRRLHGRPVHGSFVYVMTMGSQGFCWEFFRCVNYHSYVFLLFYLYSYIFLCIWYTLFYTLPKITPMLTVIGGTSPFSSPLEDHTIPNHQSGQPPWNWHSSQSGIGREIV